MSATTRLNAFMTAAAAQLDRHPSDIAQGISRGLACEQTAMPALPPATEPACSVLPGMLADPRDDLLQHLATCAGDLHWRRAGFGRLPNAASQMLAVVELIGPDAMFHAPDIRIGLLIQRGGFHYPRHWHAAEELYLVLSGTALWAVDDDDPTPRAPGSIILHASGQPHSIVTTTEPLCALWGWVGDIDGSSYSL